MFYIDIAPGELLKYGMTETIRHFAIRMLTNSYNESVSFIMSVTILLLYFKDKEFNNLFFRTTPSSYGKTDITPYTFGLFLSAGILLSIYTMFSSRKNKGSGGLLFIYILLINVFVSLFTFEYLHTLKLEYELLFPLFNIIYSYIIGVLVIYKKIDIEELFAYSNLRWYEILIDIVLIYLIILYSGVVLKNNWMVTFSICISYTITINMFIRDILKLVLKKIIHLFT